MTEPHKNLLNLVHRLEVDYVEEVPFPPYTVDVYVPSLHIAFEADGPQHRTDADKKRDYHLLGVYALPVFRFEAKDLEDPEEAFRLMAKTFMKSTYATTVEDRVSLAAMRGWVF